MNNIVILPQIYLLRNEEISMKIKRMVIDNICGIKHLDISFSSRINLICGENGVGKTTIIKAIAHQFIFGNDNFIKKYSGSEKGTVNIWLFDNDKPLEYEITKFIPGDIRQNSTFYKESNNILYFPCSRSIDYIKITDLPSSTNINTDNDILHSSELLSFGIDNTIKKWFVNRYLFSHVPYSLDEYQKNNLELSKKVFGLLDENLSVKTVQPDYEIILKIKNNDIYFEMLSDGYKSCIFILLGIIKEVEYRFPKINVVNFDGIVMIDEIDIHLHPQWQAKLVHILVQIFPNAQIIATTHSPSVLQNAKSEEIIPLSKDDNDNIHIKKLNLGEYGLQGWSLEEIMKDVMDMPSTTSNLYSQTIKEFDEAMYEENVPLIKEKYEMLCKMLHPKSPLRQILKIQMAGMEE